ncbi:MAG: holo-ACP synthase [Candidatus Eisenbacteria bacterium]|nr:holo-ACP synthase [Candidatus Eisenbacteria bacterium]
MPISVGIDIVEIDRIRKVVETRGERFLTKVYAPGEMMFCAGRVDATACLAARFAAKEAFRKAVASGPFIAWREIVVVSAESGAPFILLPAAIQKRLGGEFRMSISHSRNHAVAVVIWERE